MCKIQRTSLAKRPIHDVEPWLAATSLAVIAAEDSALPAAADRLWAMAAPAVEAASATMEVVVVLEELIVSAAELKQRMGGSNTWWEGRKARRLL